jgi:hypothetical protein
LAYSSQTGWAGRVTSLREITNDDTRHALASRPGSPGRDLVSALRSLFQALKQERMIFRDPMRGITLPQIERLPVPIPTDRLRGLIDRADGTPQACWFVNAPRRPRSTIDRPTARRWRALQLASHARAAERATARYCRCRTEVRPCRGGRNA